MTCIDTNFLQFARGATRALLAFSAVVLVSCLNAASQDTAEPALQYHVAEVSAPPATVPEGKRAPAGWSVQAIPRGNGNALELRWNRTEIDPSDFDGGARLRVTIGIDHRDEARVAVSVIGGDHLGELDIRYASTHQPFELILNEAEARAAAEYGVALQHTAGDDPLFIFDGAAHGGPVTPPFQTPHLLTGAQEDPDAAVRERLASMDTLQPFGWMEQCMIDALADLGEDSAVRERLSVYVDDSGSLNYEDPRSRPVEDRVYGIEGSGMFARVATHLPDNPSLDIVQSFWDSRREPDGVINGANTSAEGCYTVAYPQAVLAQRLNNPELAEEASRQLLLRRDRLRREDALWLRHHADRTPERTFRNWARGVAWYLLGYARTMRALDGSSQLEAEFQQASEWAIARQREDGLWAVYVDEPELKADTAAAAGIAAALTIGHTEGWLDDSAREAADRAYASLLDYVTPDGILTGGAQSNKGGEALQRSDYRVLLMPGTGLMGQLIAARTTTN